MWYKSSRERPRLRPPLSGAPEPPVKTPPSAHRSWHCSACSTGGTGNLLYWDGESGRPSRTRQEHVPRRNRDGPAELWESEHWLFIAEASMHNAHCRQRWDLVLQKKKQKQKRGGTGMENREIRLKSQERPRESVQGTQTVTRMKWRGRREKIMKSKTIHN